MTRIERLKTIFYILIPLARLVIAIPSGVENGAAGEAATWTGRPEAERTGSERIKSRGAGYR